MQVKLNYNKADLETAIKYLKQEGSYEDVLGMYQRLLKQGLKTVCETQEWTTMTSCGLHLCFDYLGEEVDGSHGVDMQIYCSPQLRKHDWMTALVEVS